MIPGAPLFFLAVLAAAIPVILHMISRRRAKHMPFSTLRFLRVSVERRGAAGGSRTSCSCSSAPRRWCSWPWGSRRSR